MSSGTFQMQISGLAGLLVPQTVTVYTSSATAFRAGLTGSELQRGGSDSERNACAGVPGEATRRSGQTALPARCYVD